MCSAISTIFFGVMQNSNIAFLIASSSASDVLSFPMFEKEEIDNMVKNAVWDYNDILGDMVISIEQVEKQAKEYGHSFERELSYMLVHGFYHLMGYDHIEEEDKKIMRPKEEKILNELKITRE